MRILVSEGILQPILDLISALQLFSSTKLVTAVSLDAEFYSGGLTSQIACLQQVDRGVVSLDDEEVVARTIPELFSHGVLRGYSDGIPLIEPIARGITLRHLLSHTSGTTYWHSRPDHGRWATENGIPMSLGAHIEVSAFATPLAFQPNTRWEYSFGMDWAGILLSRLLDQTLEAIFTEFIFRPCGMTSTTFYPTPKIKARLMGMCGVDQQGQLVLGSGSPLELARCMDHEKFGPALSGGGGLYGTARDYLRMLRCVLVSEQGGHNALLSPSSFRELFSNSVPLTAQIKEDMLRGATQQNVHPPSVLADGGNHLSHSVGLMLYGVDSEYGRKAGTAFWDGAAKTYYWLDAVSGIAVRVKRIHR